ncbi:MAG: DUF1461 domain-containing protein [Defluviitaleaceae bacterium]|nr:DUF1461 domain-containing protein [Defluviitaleaceae bacterium]
MLKYVVTITAAFTLTLVLLYIAIHIPTFSMSTYTNHFEQHNTAALIQISQQDLLAVTNRLVGYMRGTYDDLVIYATVAGQYRQFFTQREIDHMVDVLLLFQIGRWLFVVSIVLFLLSAAWIYKNKLFELMAKVQFFWGVGTMVVVLWLGWLFYTDFVRYFHIFHYIFFFFDYEQLWLLDPNVDMLVNMVPYIFFINIGQTIATIFLGAVVVITALAGYMFFKLKGLGKEF